MQKFNHPNLATHELTEFKPTIDFEQFDFGYERFDKFLVEQVKKLERRMVENVLLRYLDRVLVAEDGRKITRICNTGDLFQYQLLYDNVSLGTIKYILPTTFTSGSYGIRDFDESGPSIDFYPGIEFIYNNYKEQLEERNKIK